MSFFEPPPRTEPPTAPRVEPEWLGPPDNIRPHPFPLDLLVARTDTVAAQLHCGRAYRNGFEFALTLRRRDEHRGIGGDPFHLWHQVHETGVIPDEALRFGIEFADGEKATIFDAHRYFSTEERPHGPVLIQRGGSGGLRRWEFGFWVWPLPPAGPFAFVVEWPSEQITLTRHEIDANQIRDAAAKAEELWPNNDGGASGSRGSVTIRRIG